MIIRFLPLLLVVFLGFLVFRYYKSLQPAQRRPFIIKYAVYAVIALLLAAVVTGRIHWLGAVAAGLLALFKFGASTLLRFLPFIRLFQQTQIFGDPKFKTPHLEITLLMKNGVMTGTVISGPFEGRDILSLTDDEFDTLEAQLKPIDLRSYYLLRVIRQRSKGQSKDSDTHYNSAQVGDPSVSEAEQILGLKAAYTKKDIEHSYKRLMQKLHPDRGGNDYLASRVNSARDILIKHLDKK